MADSKPNGITGKAVPQEATGPVEAPALSQMGATFAERKAAREAAEQKAGRKQVDEAENKAVKSAEGKSRPARKKS